MPTVKELRKMATVYNIKGRSKMNKSELEAAIVKAKNNKPKRKPSRKPKRKVSRKPKRKPKRKASRKPKRKASRKPKRRVSRKPKRKVSRKPKRKVSRKPKRKVSRKPGKRTYLHVPYFDKDKVKKLGAKWDKTLKSWYYDNTVSQTNIKQLKLWPADTQENPLALLSRSHDARNKNSLMGTRNPSKCTSKYYVEIAKNNRSKDFISKQHIPKGSVKILEKYYGHDLAMKWRSYFIDSLFNSMKRRSCTDMVITGPEDYFIDPDMPGAENIELYINRLANDLRLLRMKQCKNFIWNPKSRSYKKKKVTKTTRKTSRKSTSSKKKIYIKVPYIERDGAKRLGARWDPVKRSWFFFEGSKNAYKLLSMFR